MEQDEPLTLAGAAAFLKVSPRTVSNMIKRGDLVGRQTGETSGKYLVLRSACLDYLRNPSPNRPASMGDGAKGAALCQSPSGAEYGTVISLARGKRVRWSLGTTDKKQAQELHDKLKSEAWWVDGLGDLPARSFEEAWLRWLDEKERKRSLDDDKVKIEFFVTKFSGRGISTITGEEVTRIVSRMTDINHKRKWEIRRYAAIRDGKPIPAFTEKMLAAGTKSHYLSFMRSLLLAAANEWEWNQNRCDQEMRNDDNSAWKGALKRAGISDFRFHDLRHTWASWLIQSGVPLSALQEMGAWEPIEMA